MCGSHKAALSFIPDSTGEAAFMVVAGAVTKQVLFVGSVVAKPLMFAGQKAFNSSTKFLGLSSAKEAKVAANATNAANAEEVLFSGGKGKTGINSNKYKQTGLGEFFGSADQAYEAIRSSKNDIAAISKNTGIKEENIRKVKEHLFHNEHLLDRYVEYGIPAEMKVFDSDIAIADAWKRLELGAHTQYDIQLLRHEAAEAWFMKAHGPSYTNAHNAADKKFPAHDWEKVNLAKATNKNLSK